MFYWPGRGRFRHALRFVRLCALLILCSGVLGVFGRGSHKHGYVGKEHSKAKQGFKKVWAQRRDPRKRNYLRRLPHVKPGAPAAAQPSHAAHRERAHVESRAARSGDIVVAWHQYRPHFTSAERSFFDQEWLEAGCGLHPPPPSISDGAASIDEGAALAEAASRCVFTTSVHHDADAVIVNADELETGCGRMDDTWLHHTAPKGSDKCGENSPDAARILRGVPTRGHRGQQMVMLSSENSAMWPHLAARWFQRRFEIHATTSFASEVPYLLPIQYQAMQEAGEVRPAAEYPAPFHQPAPAVVWAATLRFLDGVLQDEASKLQAARLPRAAVFMDNCAHGRAAYVYAMHRAAYTQRGPPVDSFGACLPDQAARRAHLRSDSSETDLQYHLRVSKQYMFCLAFDNGEGPGYLSERIWMAYAAGCLPVYRGEGDMKRAAPGEKSYVDSRDFDGPERLAEYLLYLAGNMTEYRSYFAWKKTRTFTEGFKWYYRHTAYSAPCRLCKLLVDRKNAVIEQISSEPNSTAYYTEPTSYYEHRYHL